MDYPEWAGYLAAFDCYLDAKARNDTEHARQARRVMDWFAHELVPVRSGGVRRSWVNHKAMDAVIEIIERG